MASYYYCGWFVIVSKVCVLYINTDNNSKEPSFLPRNVTLVSSGLSLKSELTVKSGHLHKHEEQLKLQAGVTKMPTLHLSPTSINLKTQFGLITLKKATLHSYVNVATIETRKMPPTSLYVGR